MQENHIPSDTTCARRSVALRGPGRTRGHPLSLTCPAGRVTGLI
ncbi:Fe3+-hydroxamate ABC transporter ATP-binding protein FhuC, partial [Salmonella enterica subsp. enterica serovar Infantis]